jgi:GH25 family lysozyme M1 (1,4-beta-N-acetylmuramidase)
MKGIDISAWQENVDWQVVKDAGIEFVILKLGESGELDEKFIEHVNGVVDAGLKYGIYLYSKAITSEEARQEADFVIEQIKTLLDGKQPEFGIWYDMEDGSIEESGADITGLCQAFVDRMQEAGFSYVGVYSSYNWLTNGNIDTDALDVPYWVAQYNYECNFEHPNLRIWQYTDHFSDELPYDANEYFEAGEG